MDSTLFISYASEDFDAAQRLYGELRVADMNPWIDAHKLVGGQNWRHEISSAIRESDFFIALFSNNAVNKKGYVQREIREAMDVLATVPAGTVFFIPVRLEPCEIAYPMIADLHRIDLFPEWSAGMREIQRAVRGRLDIVTSDCLQNVQLQNQTTCTTHTAESGTRYLKSLLRELTFRTSWSGNSVFSVCTRQTSVPLPSRSVNRSPGVWRWPFGLLIGCDGHLQELENLLLSGSEFRRKDHGVTTGFDFVSFDVSEESDDIEDRRSGTWSTLWIDGNGSDFLSLHGAAKGSLN